MFCEDWQASWESRESVESRFEIAGISLILRQAREKRGLTRCPFGLDDARRSTVEDMHIRARDQIPRVLDGLHGPRQQKLASKEALHTDQGQEVLGWVTG